MRNAAEKARGKAKEAAGRATGDRVVEAEGKGTQVKNDLKQAGKKLKDAAKHCTAPGGEPTRSPAGRPATGRERLKRARAGARPAHRCRAVPSASAGQDTVVRRAGATGR
ncbi:CsbD family protein [Kitasatospora sp. NPDC098663]|uniref:CsbD family protein n=1 Tax=Kitasatospora sp. NPDC098663 TaxID=3364096 RepID=UPI00382FF5FB